jgi:hypothetical protein
MRMKVAEFMGLVESGTLERLTPELRDCNARVRSVWFQVHYHTPKVHYEVWLARKIERIEIGLHFEGPQEFSYLWATLLAGHMPEIQSRLGTHVELEEWTASWARIHQTVPYDPLSDVLADEVATRLAEMITVLQPLVERERENVPKELEAAKEPVAAGRRHWRRRRSG